jgi:hypothetical protein
MEEAEWMNAWGTERLTFLQGHGSLLPMEASRFLKDYGLPRVIIFEGFCPFEIHFDRLAKNLTSYSTLIRWGDFYDADRYRAWSQQFVIGDEDFCNGSACYCVHGSSGVITRIDCELSQPESFVNSSVAQFAQALLTATRWSTEIRETGAVPSPDSLKALGDRIKPIDPAAFEAVEYFWPGLIAFLSEPEPGSLEIISDPARSKPRF